MTTPELTTERLLLRQWRDDDVLPLARINTDPQVMEFFPAPLTAEQTAEMVGRQQALLEAGLPALFATEIRETGEFIGFIGLSVPRFQAPFTPCVEIGWRLARAHWGQGYATEGAHVVLDHAFAELGLEEVVSFTSIANLRSRALMVRLGMHHDPSEDFNHPALEADDPLLRHALYRYPRPSRAVTSDTDAEPDEQD
ncbi:MAG: hypothetical protein JWQ74_1623 [Marmoricola sp.]|nr:hypothetical protein [Marmoricola sp.]